MRAVIVGVALLFTGCISTVTTYDAKGNILGRCEVTRFLWGGGTVCFGSANPKDQGIAITPREGSRVSEENKNRSPEESYHWLLGMDQDQAAAQLDAVGKSAQDAITDYIVNSKGKGSSLSWGFQVSPQLDPKERDFVTWYLQRFSQYKVH